MTTTTRLYLTNNAAGYTPTTFRGSWDATASSVAKQLGLLPGGAATTVAIAETSATNNWDVCLGRFISEPITQQTIFTAADSVQWMAGIKEANAAANQFWHVHIFVTVGNSDTVRGTLLSNSIGTTEFGTTAAGLGAGTKNLAGVVAAQVGDRIVVEIGYQAQNTVTTSYAGTLNYGGYNFTQGSPVSQLDLATAGTDFTKSGWVEFVTATDPFARVGIDANSVAVETGATTVGSLTTSLTVGSQSDRLLLAQVTFYKPGSEAVSSVVWDQGGANTAMTFIEGKTNSANNQRVELWGLLAPASGTKNLRVNFNGSSQTYASLNGTSFFNVDQTDLATAVYGLAQANGSTASADETSGTVAVGDLGFQFTSPPDHATGFSHKPIVNMDTSGSAGQIAYGAGSTVAFSVPLVSSVNWASIVGAIKAAAVPAFVSSLNPNDKDSKITLSGSNKVATQNANSATGSIVRADLSRTAGLYTFSVVLGQKTGTSVVGFGIANAAMSLTQYLGKTFDGFGWWDDGKIYINDTALSGVTMPTYGNGDTLHLAYNATTNKFFGKVNSGNWNGSGTADPITGTGGITITGLNAGPYFPALSLEVIGDNATYSGADTGGLSPSSPWDGSTLNTYSLSADYGSIAVTGQGANLKRALLLSASNLAITASGQGASLAHGYPLTAANASITASGQGASLRRTAKLSAGNATAAVTGQGASLAHGSDLLASPAILAATGQGAALRRGLRLAAGQAAFTATGQGAGLARGLKLSAGQSSIAATGQAAGLLRAYRLTAGAASVAATGQDATLSKASLSSLAASPGSYAATGQGAGLLYARRMTAGNATVAATGEPAGLAKGFTMAAGQATAAVTGQAATLRRTYRLAAGQATVAVTGQSAILTTAGQFGLIASVGQVAANGQAAGLRVDRRLSAGPASTTLFGQSIGLNRGRMMLAGSGGVVFTGQGVTLLARRLMSSGVAVIDVTGQPASLFHHLFQLPISEGWFVTSQPRDRIITSDERIRVATSDPRARVLPSP